MATFLQKKVSEEAAGVSALLVLGNKVRLEQRDRRVNSPLLPERARISKEGRKKKDKQGKGGLEGGREGDQEAKNIYKKANFENEK